MEFKTPIAAWVLSRVVSTFSSASFPLRGRIEVGGALQSTHNHLEHALDIRQHIVVPTSHYDKTLITQPSVTLGVVLGLFRVLSAVEFNN